jgi:hypothetical protein
LLSRCHMRAQLDNQRAASVFLRQGWVLVNERFNQIAPVERHGVLVRIEASSCEISDSKSCSTVRLQEGDGNDIFLAQNGLRHSVDMVTASYSPVHLRQNKDL